MLTQSEIHDSEIDYPESDGKPIAESPLHFSVFMYLLNGFTFYFRNQLDIYVGGGNFLYYQKGNPSASLVPDIFIVRGMDKKPRDTFKTWVEQRVPAVIVEITSDETIEYDLGTKKMLYQQLGVQEYFLYDPERIVLNPALQGFRLLGGEYEKITVQDESVKSNELGFLLQVIENNLRIVQPDSYYMLPTAQEAFDQLRAVNKALTIANEQTRESEARARVFELDNVRLRAELEKLRGKQD